MPARAGLLLGLLLLFAPAGRGEADRFRLAGGRARGGAVVVGVLGVVPRVVARRPVLLHDAVVLVERGAGARAHPAQTVGVHIVDPGVDPLVARLLLLGVAQRALGLPGLAPFAVPLLFEPRELRAVERAQPPGAALAEALGRAVAQQEHQQAVVVDRAAADQLAVGIDRDLDPVERALHRHVLDPLDPEIERGLPRRAEALRRGVAAQQIGAVIGAPHRAAGARDAAGVGQRLDEGELDRGRPAVGALLLARDGGEGGEHAAPALRGERGGGCVGGFGRVGGGRAGHPGG